MNEKKSKIAGCVLILILAYIVFFKTPEKAKSGWQSFVTIQRVGYTNDASGNKLAIFTLTNPSESPLRLRKEYWVQVPWAFGSSGKTLSANSWPKELLLESKKSQTVLVPVPFGEPRWRLFLFARKEEHLFVATGRNLITTTANRLGKKELADKFYNFTRGVTGPWIDE